MMAFRHRALPIRRIPHLLRPLRPPNPANQTSRPRHFTQNSHKLLLVSTSTPRPQLPFLHNATSSRLAKVSVRSQINRLISTERKARWKRTFKWQLRFHLFFWPAITLVALAGTSSRQLMLEQKYPTPPDWTQWSRWIMRNRKDAEYSDEYRHGALNWDFLGKGYLELLERLERGADSKDVKEVEEGGILIEGVGKAGYDVSSKSGTWKQGYFEALMGAAKVAENLDGWVKNKDGKSLSFPREMVPSPENPEPALIPVNWRGTPPRIEDAISAFESPATFYAKVLTTRGLTTRMKTEAALAWADWLDFKGLHGTAEEVLKWGLDIASQGMNASQLSDVLDMKRSNLKVKGSLRVSENMLKTCTALAVHHARSGSVEKALSLFLSIMKIRKDLASKMAPVMELPQVPEETDFVESVMQLIRGPGYPPIPSSGDEPPNDALKEACEQTGIMAYIGEILYATSSKEEGLSWTRDAVDGAEQVLSAMQGQASQAGKEKCEECLETGLLNWQEMASSLAALEYTSGQKEPKSSWFGVWKKREHDEDRWAREQEQIQLRIERTKPFLKERFGQVQVVSPS